MACYYARRDHKLDRYGLLSTDLCRLIRRVINNPELNFTRVGSSKGGSV